MLLLRKYFYALLALVAGTGIFILYRFNPEEESFFPKCPSKMWTGLHCPGCGSTRAVYHLLRLDFEKAFDRNPLLLIALPIMALMVACPKITRHRATPWISFAVLLVYGILRNIDRYPFTHLAP